MSAWASSVSVSARRKEWHLPDFGASLCSTLDDRERLGLPKHFVPARFSGELPALYDRVRSWTKQRLLEGLISCESSLALRLACGQQLALVGDPRLRPEHPEMLAVSGGCVSVGLEPSQIDKVMSDYAGLGLNRSWIEKETPRHEVSLAPFRLARFPVTNEEFRAFLLDTGYPEIPSSWAFRQFPQNQSNHPVYTVSADAADAYARWLSARTGRGFRLPSEAEWEWAAAGPQGREFPWGEEFDADLANTAETGLFRSSPVGAFVGGEGPFGHVDLAGNVEEYVADNYAAYPGGTFVADHLVRIHGTYRVARGGSFARFRDLARNCRRHGHNPRSATYAMGFRLAETL